MCKKSLCIEPLSAGRVFLIIDITSGFFEDVNK